MIRKGDVSMKIGEVIRSCRKNRNLTQEEMARRLGVTAPAVNKWEKNVSLPDITLLAPIARLLETTPDTLLSFQEELSPEEINDIVQEADAKFQKTSYEEAFEFCRNKIRQYPGCDRLALHLAAILDGWRILKAVPDSEKTGEYDSEILNWYQQALQSEEAETRERAADALFSYYFRKENYEEAEQYLEYFSRTDPIKKIHKALIHEKKGDRKAAYKEYEELLLQTGNVAEMVLGGMFALAEKDGDLEMAEFFTEKMIRLSRLFETGSYHQLTPMLSLFLMKKDREKIRQCMEDILNAVDEMDAYRNSRLYSHMEFKPLRPEFAEQMKTTLRESFQNDPVYGIIHQDLPLDI